MRVFRVNAGPEGIIRFPEGTITHGAPGESVKHDLENLGAADGLTTGGRERFSVIRSRFCELRPVLFKSHRREKRLVRDRATSTLRNFQCLVEAAQKVRLTDAAAF